MRPSLAIFTFVSMLISGVVLADSASYTTQINPAGTSQKYEVTFSVNPDTHPLATALGANTQYTDVDPPVNYNGCETNLDVKELGSATVTIEDLSTHVKTTRTAPIETQSFKYDEPATRSDCATHLHSFAGTAVTFGVADFSHLNVAFTNPAQPGHVFSLGLTLYTTLLNTHWVSEDANNRTYSLNGITLGDGKADYAFVDSLGIETADEVKLAKSVK